MTEHNLGIAMTTQLLLWQAVRNRIQMAALAGTRMDGCGVAEGVGGEDVGDLRRESLELKGKKSRLSHFPGPAALGST